MFFEIGHRAGLVISGLIGCAVAVYCYGSEANDLSLFLTLAITGAASGIASWLVMVNGYLNLHKG